MHLAPEARRIGMVFQDYALFPHLSVADNVAFGVAHLPRAERQARVQQMLDLVGLAHAAQRAPHQLSGGQQQRIALARALAPQPQLLLLDEPFSSLDVDLRETLAQELRAILKASGTTALFVTHDQFEAFALGDVIGVMHQGRLEQWDDAYTLYHRPAHALRRRLHRPRRLHAGADRRLRARPLRAHAAGRAERPRRMPAAGGLPRRASATCCCAPTTSCTTTPAR